LYRHRLVQLTAPFLEMTFQPLERANRSVLQVGGISLVNFKPTAPGDSWNPSLEFRLDNTYLYFGVPRHLDDLDDREIRFLVPVSVTHGGILLIGFCLVLTVWCRIRIRAHAESCDPLLSHSVELAAIVGALLISVNVVGGGRTLGTENLGELKTASPLGTRDRTLTWPETRSALSLLDRSDPDRFVLTASDIVSSRITHNWSYINLEAMTMQVPLWENWLLWWMGEISPKYREYHFADHMLNLERGAGNCGHASTALLGLLEGAGIESKILGLRGHTMVWARTSNSEYILDPDYGTSFRGSFEQYLTEPELSRRYLEAFAKMGMPKENYEFNMTIVQRALHRSPPELTTLERFHGNLSFERQSYRLKWAIPALLLLPYLLNIFFPVV
jgi:hypothetical protein